MRGEGHSLGPCSIYYLRRAVRRNSRRESIGCGDGANSRTDLWLDIVQTDIIAYVAVFVRSGIVVADATATFDKKGIDGQNYPAALMHDTALASLNNEFATVVTTDFIKRSLLSKLNPIGKS